MTPTKLPELISEPASDMPQCHVIWDEESQVVFAGMERHLTEPVNLSQQIERAFSASEPERRLVIGTLDMLLDRHGKFESLESRVGHPASWQRCSLPPVVNVEGPVTVTFDNQFDNNGIAVVDARVITLFDSDSNELAFQMEGIRSARYMKVADKVCFGVDKDSRLAEIRLELVLVDNTAG